VTARESAAQTRPLLRLELRRRSLRPGRRVLFTVLLPLMNLFFCAYYERFFETEHDLPALQLFLMIESSALALLAVVCFVTALKEIVMKTVLLPVGSFPLAVFVAFSLFRDPLALGVLITGAFGLAIMLHPSATVLPFVLLFMVLLASGVQTIVGSALLVASTRSDRAAGLTLIAIVALLGTLLWSLLFRTDMLPALLPPVLWTSVGIMSAIGGEWGTMLGRLLLLTAITPMVLAVSVRWAGRT